MALNAGKLLFTLEYGKDLKDMDFFGKQDPYALIKCGGQTYRSKTHTDGGRHPVWAQTFEFNVINENTIEVAVYDEDTITRDDLIGTTTISLATVREKRADKVSVPLVSKKGKQHGYIFASMTYTTNDSLKAPVAPAPMPQHPMMAAAAAYAPVAYPMPMAPPAGTYYMPQQPQPVMAPVPMNMMGQPMYYTPGLMPMPVQQQQAPTRAA